MLTEKGRARHKMLMEVVWREFESAGGITVGRLVEETGISSYQMYTALWTLLKKGMIAPVWSPTGKGKGAMYVVLPGPRAWKIRLGKKVRKPREAKTPETPIVGAAPALKNLVLTPLQQAEFDRLRGKKREV